MAKPAGLKKEETHERIMNPVPGDRFTEMFAFWVHVMEVSPSHVTVEEYNPPCKIGKDAKVRHFTREEFQKAYAYKTIPGYSVRYIDRKAPMDHWKPRQMELWKEETDG